MVFRAKLKGLALCLTLVLLLPALCRAEGETIYASKSRLNVNGWELIMPQIVGVDKKTGRTTVRYNYPGGSYQSYPLALGEPITPRWIKTGVEGFNATPGGYSEEATQDIFNWWTSGGKGHYVVDKNGQWQRTNKSAPPLPQPYNADTGGGGGGTGGGAGGGASKQPVQDAKAKRAKELRDAWQALSPGPDKDAAYKMYIDFANSQGNN